MVDNTSKIGDPTKAASSTASLNKASTPKLTNEQISKNQFLQLLVTQLKNQDPMEPKNPDEFAAQLAQFSQLEQLMSINEKIGSTSGADSSSSLPGYLGNEVTIKSDSLHLNAGAAGSLKFDLATNALGLDLELKDKTGNVVERKALGALKAGKYTVEIGGLSSPNGDYQFDLVARNTNGSESKVSANQIGMVTGFVPGPSPKLLVGNREVTLDQILEVNLAQDQSKKSDPVATKG